MNRLSKPAPVTVYSANDLERLQAMLIRIDLEIDEISLDESILMSLLLESDIKYKNRIIRNGAAMSRQILIQERDSILKEIGTIYNATSSSKGGE